MPRSLVALVLALLLPLPVLAGQVTVKPGETLSEIAERNGISVTRLMAVNGLRDADQVKAGQVLTIPGGAPRARASGSARSGGGGTITVRAGETLSELAERSGTSVTRLMALNGIRDADQLQAGQVLAIPGGAPRAGASGSVRSGGGGTITVRAGETLSELAERSGTSVTRLMALNGIRDADQLQVGQVLAIPGAPRASGSARSGGGGTITVQPGETLSELADRHGIGLNQLMQLNGLRDPDSLEAGQSLRVSRARPAAPPPSYPRGASSHVVRSGESLSVIASGYGISLNKLIAINGIEDPQLVEAGTRLKLKSPPPVRASAPSRPAASATRPAAAAGGSVRPSAASVAVARPAPSRPAPSRPAASPGGASTVPVPSPAAAAAPRTSTSLAAASAPAASPAAPRSATGATPRSSASTVPASSVDATSSVAAVSPAAAAAPAPRTSSTSTSTSLAAATAAAASPAAPRPARGRATAPAATSLARADWRTYGPLQVNWSAWQSLGGSMVAPTLNARGQALYVAVNCSARKINATTDSGQWQAWGDPGTDYERQLIRDYCRSGG